MSAPQLTPAELAAHAAEKERADAKAKAEADAARAAGRWVTLIGGGADGDRVERPTGDYLTASVAGGGKEGYRKRLVYLRDGVPVEFWASNGLADDIALRRALDAYTGA